MCENLIVIGCHRRSIQLIRAVVEANDVENLRVTPIYHPKIAKIAEKYRDEQHVGASIIIDSKASAEAFAEAIPHWVA